jgi:hypothetical protein
LQVGQPLLESSQSRLELVDFDDLVSVAIDQSVDSTT